MTKQKPKPKKMVLNIPFAVHVEIDIEAISESDGETFTITQDAIIDQLKYVFERLQHKNVKVSYKMSVTPESKEVVNE